jgi:shikimate kinase
MKINEDMNIFLIGYMGSGKTTFGKYLAKKLDLNFIDMDSSIQQEEGVKIDEIFQTTGESGFRKIENKWLLHFNQNNTLVSLGGGTPCFHDNLSIIREKGKIIYLKMSPAMLRDRLISAKTTRPLIEPFKHDPESLLEFIKESLQEREPYYSRADMVLKGYWKDKRSALNEVVATFNF